MPATPLYSKSQRCWVDVYRDWTHLPLEWTLGCAKSLKPSSKCKLPKQVIHKVLGKSRLSKLDRTQGLIFVWTIYFVEKIWAEKRIGTNIQGIGGDGGRGCSEFHSTVLSITLIHTFLEHHRKWIALMEVDCLTGRNLLRVFAITGEPFLT